MKIRNYEVFRIHAEFCRTLANPKRLMIAAVLSEQEMSVGKLAACIDVPLPTVSQHLAVLKSKHVVEVRKEGQQAYYRLVDPRLMDACQLIRTVLLDGMRHRGELASRIDPAGFELYA